MPNVSAFHVILSFLFVLHFCLCVESQTFETKFRNLRTQEKRVPDEFMIVLDRISISGRNDDRSDYIIRPFFKLYSPDPPKYSGLGTEPGDTTIVDLEWIVDGVPFKNLGNDEVMSSEQYPYIFHTGLSFANPRIKNMGKKSIALSISMVHTDYIKRSGEQDKSDPLFRSVVSLLISFRLGYLNQPTAGTNTVYNMSMVNYTFSREAENTINAHIEVDSNGKNDFTTFSDFHADFKGIDVSSERRRTIHLRNPDDGRTELSIHDEQIDNGDAGTRSASAKFILDSAVANKYRGILKTGFTYENYYSDVRVTFDATNLLTEPEQSRFGLFGKPVASFFSFFQYGFNFTWSPNKPGYIPCYAVGYPIRKIEMFKISGGTMLELDERSHYMTSFDTKYETLSILTIPKPKQSDAARYVCYSKLNTSDTSYSTFHYEFDITWVGN